MQTKQYPNVIGKNIIKDFSKIIEVISPINNQVVGIIPRVSTKVEIENIFKEAKSTFSWWKDSNYQDRKNKILKFINLVEKKQNELAEIMMWEIAKTKHESLNEIQRSLQYIKETIVEYENIINNPLIIDETKHHVKGKVGKFIYQPLGVVLAISPFNYPFNLLIAKIIPALISGNVVVYKPASQGSIIGSYVGVLLYKSGFNEGQISCLIGKGSEIGDIFIKNENIDMITFTGSTSIGKKITKEKQMIPLVLELGGKDPAIVLHDADLELVSNEIIKGSFGYNGQRCTAIKRVLVDSRIHEKLKKLLDQKIAKLSVGTALEPNDITELISKKSLDYNLTLIDDALNQGATTHQEIKKDGLILHPIILDNVNLDMKIAWEEPFGPILPIIEFKSIDDAIEIANQSEYGLQASIFTSNLKQAHEIALKLESGTININRAPSRGPDIFPFSGVKNSGFGIQGIRDAIFSMNRIKGIIDND